MDATVIAIAGIGGTLLASVLSPIVAGRAQRAALRDERILDRRLDAYTDLLETLRHLHENAQEWSALPLSDLEEPPSERLGEIDARMRTVASDEVRQAMLAVTRPLARFQRELWSARLRHQRDESDTHADTVEAIAARIGLGKIADEVTTAIDNLEATIRKELKISKV